MRNGRIVKTLVLAVSVAWLAGCDSNAMPRESASELSRAEAPRLVDAGRGRVWTLTRDGLFLQQIASTERRAIALPDWTIVDPQHYGSEPALALGPGGDVLVTSNILPVIWRVDPRSLAVSVHTIVVDAHQDRDFGFTSLAYSPRDAAFVATSDAPQARWRIDAGLTRAEKIAQ